MRTGFWVLLAGAAVYEIVTLTNRAAGDTISEIVWEATAHRPLVPFAIGCLCGHFFWQRAESRAPESPASEL